MRSTPLQLAVIFDFLPGDPAPHDVPPDVLDAARQAFTSFDRPGGSRPPQSELAAIVFDSLLDGTAGPESHWLRFEHPMLGINVHVARQPTTTLISGELEPANPARVALHLEPAALAMVADAFDGHFSFTPVGHGLVRLSVEEQSAAPSVWTDWFRI